MERMSEEIELAAKSIGSAVGELAERSGLTGPPNEIVSFLSAYIHPRRGVFAAKQLASAAEKVRRAGLPPAAIRDDTLRALVEGGSLADDENMHERWANFLANACLDSKAKVPVHIRAFSETWSPSRQQPYRCWLTRQTRLTSSIFECLSQSANRQPGLK